MKIRLKSLRWAFWLGPGLALFGTGMIFILVFWTSGKESSALDYLSFVILGVVYCIAVLLLRLLLISRNR